MIGGTKELFLENQGKLLSLPAGVSFDRLSLFHNLASLHVKLQDFSDAKAYLEEVLKIRQEALNKGDTSQEQNNHIADTQTYLDYVKREIASSSQSSSSSSSVSPSSS